MVRHDKQLHPQVSAPLGRRRPSHVQPSTDAAGRTVPQRFSPSALARYRTCPRQFFLQDVCRTPVPDQPKPVLAVGNAVHAALDRFFGLRPDDRQPPDELIVRALRSVWRAHVPTGLFDTTEEEREAGLRAADNLVRLMATIDPLARPAAREQWVAARVNGARVYGKVDRIDLAADGTLELIDYKTGRQRLADEDVAREPAAQVYAVGAEARLGRAVSRVRFIYLDGDGSQRPTEARWEPEREDIEAAAAALDALIDDIRADPTFATAPGEQCRYCPFRFICPDANRVELSQLEIPDDITF
jgi:RecB family exonuclease